MRLGDLDALKIHISELMLVYKGTELDNAILNAIDNAQTFDVTKNQAYDQGFITAMRLYSKPQGEWKFKKFDEETGISNSDWCPFCGKVKAQVYDNFCGNCGAKMEVRKNDED